jgi:hypothetical protein
VDVVVRLWVRYQAVGGGRGWWVAGVIVVVAGLMVV